MFLAVAVLILGSQGSTTSEHSVASIINDCWKNHDHAGMSACLEARAREARVGLSHAENLARDAIRASVDEPGFPEYRKQALARLKLASSAFSQYVASECAYEAALASKGNGAEDVRLACIAMLSEDRAQRISGVFP